MEKWKDPSLRFLPADQNLQCVEEVAPNNQHHFEDNDDDEDTVKGSVMFSCNAAVDDESYEDGHHRLHFYCRNRSSGVMTEKEKERQQDAAAAASDCDDEEGKDQSENHHHAEAAESIVNPFFFDKGYTLLASTGFQIWPGARFLTEALLYYDAPAAAAGSRLRTLQERIRGGGGSVSSTSKSPAIRILELGSGVGFTGICLAAAGAQVLITDLPTLVTHSVNVNIRKNQNRDSSRHTCGSKDDVWPPGAVPVFRGWAGSAVLDFTQPLDDQQLIGSGSTIDLILASDCLHLRSMMPHVLNLVASVFARSPQASWLLTYQRRSPNPLYTTMETVVEAIQTEFMWNVDCVAWRPIVCGTYDDGQDEINDVYLLNVTQKNG